MGTVNVVVTTSIGNECLQQINTSSPLIRVTDISGLVNAEWAGDLASRDKLDALLAEAEVLYGFGFPKNITARAPKLKWIQAMSAGIDRLLDNELRRGSVIVTTMSGIHATPVGELVLALMLMFAKQAPLYLCLKQKRQWKRFAPTVLRSKTVGIVGLGSIGREVARLAKAFGMKVLATRRSAKRVARARYVDAVLPQQQLSQLLSDSDFVVLTLPLTSETKGLIGQTELRTMKTTAYLINVARGNIVDEEALIQALQEHQIAGAGLDVFTTEPLPPDSKLWELPNAILTCHIAGVREDYNIEATKLFCENIRRYLNREKLLNLVDMERGY